MGGSGRQGQRGRAPLVTLRDVVDALGPAVLEVDAAGAGLDIPVTDVVIHDPTGPFSVGRGDIVLAIGVRPDEARAEDAVRETARLGAAAIVFRGPVSNDLAAIAEQAQVAVLSAPPEATWGQLHALMRTAVGAAGRALRTGEELAPAGDLFTLANAVAAMVGGPITIEDPQSRVLAYSNLGQPIDEVRRRTILGRRVPEERVELLREEGFFARLWSSDDVVEHGGGPGHGRLAIAVKAGDEVLGQIWAADGGRPFQPQAHEAMREAAPMAALHLVRHRMGEDLERRMRGELLRALLNGRGSVDAIAQRLGTEPATVGTVVAFQIEGDDDATVALGRERVRELVVTYSESYRRRSTYVALDRILYVLLFGGATEPGEVDDLAARLAHDVVARSEEALGLSVRAAIGSTVRHLRDVPESRAEADRVLEVFARYGFARRTAHVEDVRAYTALLELEKVVVERRDLRLRKLDDLIRYDAEHGSEYIPSLRAYLDAFGDVIQAAKSLHVHPNTLRYRLRRLIEFSGLDVENPDERIVIELQLRAT